MKIVVMTDVHANLPALQAALNVIRAEGYDAFFHTGDAIAIGPYPAECMELLLDLPNAHFVMGNHEDYFVNGVRPSMSEGEKEHQAWTHAQLGPALRAVVAQWPWHIKRDIEGVETAFVHYPLTASGRNFAQFYKAPTAENLDGVFTFPPGTGALNFFGHTHEFCDIRGRAHYVNSGSLGVHRQAVARYAVLTFRKGDYAIEHRSIPYDDAPLFAALEHRQVPDRALIRSAFFGR